VHFYNGRAHSLSIGTWLISHDGKQVPQDRKASVSWPPTGSSTDRSISTEPAQPQTLPVYRILVKRNRVVANAVRRVAGAWRGLPEEVLP
jgi:hypothetical protein